MNNQQNNFEKFIHNYSYNFNKTFRKIDFKKLKSKFIAKDKNQQLVFLSDSSFSLEMTKQKFPTLKFHYKSEF